MQAGTTGINALRVYNVTKQGKDQDPEGVFIRKYVTELQNVPAEYIHEPSNMPASVQKKYGVIIGNADCEKSCQDSFQVTKQFATGKQKGAYIFYPSPIVDEKKTAKIAKERVSSVRKQRSTKIEAEQVFLKHGSRRFRGVTDRDGVKPKALSSSVKRVKMDYGQASLLDSWKSMSQEQSDSEGKNEQIYKDKESNESSEVAHHDEKKEEPTMSEFHAAAMPNTNHPSIARLSVQREVSDESNAKGLEWNCKMCTYLNDKPFALVCAMCGSMRQ